MKKYFFLIPLAILSACVTLSPNPATDEYVSAVEEFTAGDQVHEGAYNNFNYRATVMTPDMQRLYINKKAEVYLWSDEKRSAELTKLSENNDKSTQIFLSFFTPNRWDDNLSTSKSIWSVYLQNGANRYEGKVTKNRESRTELNVMFPYHGRFATAYMVQFFVPVSELIMSDLKVTIAGPLGAKTVQFTQSTTAVK